MDYVERPESPLTPTSVLFVPMVSPGERKPRSMSATKPMPQATPGASTGKTSAGVEVAAPQPISPDAALPKPDLCGGANADVVMHAPRQRIVVPSRHKHSTRASTSDGPSVTTTSGAGAGAGAGASPRSVVAESHSAQCEVSGPSAAATSVFRDVRQAPVRMVMTQSVRKSNDRRSVTAACHAC